MAPIFSCLFKGFPPSPIFSFSQIMNFIFWTSDEQNWIHQNLWSNIITVHQKELPLKNMFVYFGSAISTFESISKLETNIFSPHGLLFQLFVCSTQTKSSVYYFLLSSLPPLHLSFIPSFLHFVLYSYFFMSCLH